METTCNIRGVTYNLKNVHDIIMSGGYQTEITSEIKRATGLDDRDVIRLYNIIMKTRQIPTSFKNEYPIDYKNTVKCINKSQNKAVRVCPKCKQPITPSTTVCFNCLTHIKPFVQGKNTCLIDGVPYNLTSAFNLMVEGKSQSEVMSEIIKISHITKRNAKHIYSNMVKLNKVPKEYKTFSPSVRNRKNSYSISVSNTNSNSGNKHTKIPVFIAENQYGKILLIVGIAISTITLNQNNLISIA